MEYDEHGTQEKEEIRGREKKFSVKLESLSQMFGAGHLQTSHRSRGGGPFLYKLYSYVRRQRVWFLSLFGLK